MIAADRVLYNQLSNALASAAESHARGRLLDIGCGRKPWAPIFAPYVSEHVGIDPDPSAPGADVIAGAYDVPLEDETADAVLLTEVLEHLEDPLRGLREARRLLKAGGAVILTTPLLFPVHDRRDFFRYCPAGLEHLMTEAGFTELSVRPLSGQWTTLATLRGISLHSLRRGPVSSKLVDAYSTLSLALAVRLDKADFRAAFSWNHIATGRKA